MTVFSRQWFVRSQEGCMLFVPPRIKLSVFGRVVIFRSRHQHDINLRVFLGDEILPSYFSGIIRIPSLTNQLELKFPPKLDCVWKLFLGLEPRLTTAEALSLGQRPRHWWVWGSQDMWFTRFTRGEGWWLQAGGGCSHIF